MAKIVSATIYPLSALRAMVLYTQRLTSPNNFVSTSIQDEITDTVKSLGYVQIDTLNVVNRAHYASLWSRIGPYDINEFNKMIYTTGQRMLYEGWGHAACLIPLEHYRYHRWRIDTRVSYNPGFKEWLSKDDNQKLVAQTLERIRTEGRLSVDAFEYSGPKHGVWYDWKLPKMALEALFARGDLMVADRVNFQRVYDITERVLPGWVDSTPIAPDKARRICLEQAAKALGVFMPRNLTFYAYMRATPAQSILRVLIDEGMLVEIQGESTRGQKKWMVHRDNLPLLQRAADGELKAERTTFLTPFDSFFWAQDRDQILWGFDQVLECYKPAAQRIYGYFCFPILHKDRLVGRLDPKLDRKSGLLTINALYLEPGIEPDDELVAGIAAAMRDFLAWHEAKELKIEKSTPSGFREKLIKAL